MGGGIDCDGQGYRILENHNDGRNQNGESQSVVHHVPHVPAIGEGVFPVVMGAV